MIQNDQHEMNSETCHPLDDRKVVDFEDEQEREITMKSSSAALVESQEGDLPGDLVSLVSPRPGQQPGGAFNSTAQECDNYIHLYTIIIIDNLIMICQYSSMAHGYVMIC